MTAPRKPELWTAAAVAAATGGDGGGDWSATGVSIDSRTLEPGDLFVAISGPNFDGHDFVAAAFEAGAAAAVVSRPRADVPGISSDATLITVRDTFAALESLAEAARARTDAGIVAVTGSVGKTGTKEALRLVLAAQGAVTATEGNLNNHWGLPLSLSRMPQQSAFGVFELGMNHAGELLPLTAMTRPHVAVVTTVESVHSENFNGIEGIADAKAEIFTGLEPGGTAVIFRDTPLFERLARAAEAAGVENIRTFGEHDAADVRLVECALNCDGSHVRAALGGRALDYDIGVPGRHWVINSLAVLAAVDALGADAAAAARSLADLHGLKGRGERHTVALADGTFVLIDESYNASPASMAAALEVLAQGRTEAGGRRIAVLGDMLELGDEADTAHAALAEVLVARGIDLVFTAGQHMAALWQALPPALRGGQACMADKIIPLVTAAARPGDVIMVKGSNGSRVGTVVDALLSLGNGGNGDQPRAVNGE